MGFLDGGLTGLVGAAFGWILLDGTLHPQVETQDGKGGLTIADGTPIPIKIMVDPDSKDYRGEEGYADSDVSILFLRSRPDGLGDVPYPNIRDKVTVRGEVYDLLTPIKRDAAITHYTARGRLIEAETDPS